MAVEPLICPECGAKLPAECPPGRCPKCLLALGLGGKKTTQGLMAADMKAISVIDSRDRARLELEGAVPTHLDLMGRSFPEVKINRELSGGVMGVVCRARKGRDGEPIHLDKFFRQG